MLIILNYKLIKGSFRLQYMSDFFLDYFFFPLLGFGFIIFGLTNIIKGWTYRNSKVEDVETMTI